MIEVEYQANNSGGSWWLKDADWYKLEAAGWNVDWVKDWPKDRGFDARPDGRGLGCLAKEATKSFASMREAVAEFERITGQNADDEGCNCCGPPHYFHGTTEDGKYVYFESAPASYRRTYGDES